MAKSIAVLLALATLLSAAAAAKAQQVDNPVYKSWSACKVGTSVTIKLTAQLKVNGGRMMVIERLTTLTLKEIKPDEIVLEEADVEFLAGVPKPPDGEPPKKRTIPAKVDKAVVEIPNPDVSAERITGVKTGKDTITVGGKKYDAATVEFVDHGSGGLGPDNCAVKIWSSADVPGLLLKEEAQAETQPDPSEMRSTKTLVEVKRP